MSDWRAALPRRVRVVEVGPRDGLQNEAARLSTDDKLALIDALAAAGLPLIELTSFVSPRWIPPLADHAEVAARARRRPGTTFSALVPNRRGLDGALAAGLGEVAVFLSASETHNRKNVNKSIADTLAAFAEVLPPARAAGLRVRAYVSTVFGCPYEGAVAPARVRDLARALHDAGCYEISLGDTIGVAHPAQVAELLEVVGAAVPRAALALHLHDTRGTALANVLAGLIAGVTTVDASVGGLGGCPYAPGAAGNLATEDLVSMLHGMGIETGVALDALLAAAELAQRLVGRALPSKTLQAHLGARARAAGER